MNTREIKLNNLYNAMRERLVSRYASEFNGVGADAEEAVAIAFAYAANPLLNREGDFTANDLEKLICNKVNLLFKDAFSASKREHGRRSVKAVAILDEEPGEGDDYRVSLIDKCSMEHFERTASEGDENLFLLQAKAIDCVFAKYGMSERDRIINDRSLWCAPDQTALAAELGTSVSNVRRVKCVGKRFILEHKDEIRKCYEALKNQYEMERC